jgi:hypothetical protein
VKDFEKVKAATLAHYDRMIAWAEKQPQDKRHSGCSMRCDMRDELGENWTGTHCPMCLANRNRNGNGNGNGGVICDNCPIKLRTGQDECIETPWEDFWDTNTWGEWLIVARKERTFLASLEDK